MRPHGRVPGITYRFLEQAPLFEFGFGMSYTNFSFAWDGSSKQTIKTQAVQAGFKPYFANRGAVHSENPVTFTVNVKNTGAVASDIVVLCFVSSKTNQDGPRYVQSQALVSAKPFLVMNLPLRNPTENFTFLSHTHPAILGG